MHGQQSTPETIRFQQTDAVERPVGRSIRRGMLNRCPACGEGRLFRSFLKSVDACSSCGERMDHHRADDFPPYIVVTIMGHLVLGGFMMTEMLLTLSNWGHLAIWVPITIIGSLALLTPVKGGVIGLQWALRMHGFGGHDDEPEDELPPLPARDTSA
ncbi:DUF983 domain-containing protein [Pararhizobium antarcticum]|uniref:Zinc-finger protein n=1 Tax=Pararhizobium antarcticum TaxID=1798805 RepID=A0A657LWY3_9HYPH|nr:DUF983 domain-containing protein [Pararhizobium antarcticum]OJG00248.1 hypothetical protein AX760_11020 [Pararhizobium antarcticum]OJG00879.1 hypothetical protein AX761_08130 [Rhizobium sp. 58]